MIFVSNNPILNILILFRMTVEIMQIELNR